jgi:serine phosphatase RsbU (regulator of sigma subunit)
MERGPRQWLSWMLLPVSALLVFTALSLTRQAYTGLSLRDEWIAAVDPGSPGARAGLERGDRLIALDPLEPNPVAGARPGEPLTVLRERGSTLTRLVLIPEAPPRGERHMMAALLAVACGFVVLGGWVWSQRRDRLTRTFFLLCLAFALLIAPFPRLDSPLARLLWEAFYSGVSVVLPALFVHFFALFPESERPRGLLGSVTRIAYGVAAGLFLAALALVALPALTGVPATAALELLQGVAGLWFALGLLTALALFVRSYRRAGSSDTRRRLRVALVGTVLGVGPLAALVAMRNLFPGAPLPFERWAVLLTLLVPASFAWAAAVHRVFEVRVALRTASVVAVLGLAGALLYVAGEWLAAAWRADLGAGIAGGALAFCALTASAAGPVGGLLRGLGARLVPERDQHSPAERFERATAGGAAGSRRPGPDELLLTACEAVAGGLMLDGCLALELGLTGPRAVALAGVTRTPALAPGFLERMAPIVGIVRASSVRLEGVDRAAFEAAGVCWILPLGEAVPRVFLLLGRRLAGPWLSLPEIHDLERLAAHLDLLLENATLREQASVHGALDRAMTRAGTIQAHLRPRRIPAYPSLDCAAAALSSEPVGGDYYDFVRGPRRTFTLAVGDAAGKGVPAALMGVWAQACFRQQARLGARPGEVLSALNRELVGMDQPEAFVALLCARVDAREGRLWFANAGLTPPLLRRHDGRFEELVESGMLLGITHEAAYSDAAVELGAGDLIVLYTDGLTEACRGDELFGTARLREIVDRHADRPAGELLRVVLDAAQTYADRPLDDVTVVVLKQVARPAGRRRTAKNGPQMALKLEPRPADLP